jgi:hypothetical protein
MNWVDDLILRDGSANCGPIAAHGILSLSMKKLLAPVNINSLRLPVRISFEPPAPAIAHRATFFTPNDSNCEYRRPSGLVAPGPLMRREELR